MNDYDIKMNDYYIQMNDQDIKMNDIKMNDIKMNDYYIQMNDYYIKTNDQFYKNMQTKIKGKNIILVLISICLLTYSINTENQLQNSVMILSASNFPIILQLYPQLVIFFSSQNCQYCTQFYTTYLLLVGKYQQIYLNEKMVAFAKLTFNKDTQHLFKQYRVDMAPQIRFFYQGAITKHTYQTLIYDHTILQQLIIWTKRVSLIQHNTFQFKQFDQGQIKQPSKYIYKFFITKMVVFACNILETNQQFKKFIQKLIIQNLDHDFYCQNKNLQTKQLSLTIYQKRLSDDLYQIQKHSEINLQKGQSFIQFSLPSQLYDYNFNQYMYNKIQIWSNKSILQTFSHNKSCFLLITNDQTRSQTVLSLYSKIKQNWNQQMKLPFQSFYYSNLATHLQETTKIRLYMIGFGAGQQKTYPYPILGYLMMDHQVGKVIKYVFPINQEITYNKMKKWMNFIVRKVQLNLVQSQIVLQNIQQQIQTQFKFKQTPYYSQTTQCHFTYNNSQALLTKADRQPNKKINTINYKDFKVLLSTLYDREFFVYINWRNDLKSYQVMSQLKIWWEHYQRIKESQQNHNQQHKPQNYNQEHKPSNAFQRKLTQFLIEPKVPETQKIQQNHQVQKILQHHQTQQIKQNNQVEIQKIKNQVSKLKQINVEQKVQQNKIPDKADSSVHQKQLRPTKQAQRGQNNKQNTSDQEIDQTPKIPKANPFSLLTNIWVLNLNGNDYPTRYKDINDKTHYIRIDYIPSMLYFSKDKTQMNIIEGFQKVQEVTQFIWRNLKQTDQKSNQGQQPILKHNSIHDKHSSIQGKHDEMQDKHQII